MADVVVFNYVQYHHITLEDSNTSILNDNFGNPVMMRVSSTTWTPAGIRDTNSRTAVRVPKINGAKSQLVSS